MSSTKLFTQNVAKRKESDDVIDEIDSKRARTDTAPGENTVKSVDVTSVSNKQMLDKLHDAVKSRDVKRLRELLEHKPKLDSLVCGDLLWIVIEDDDTEIATMLVQAGTNVNRIKIRLARRRTLLHALIKKGSDPKKLELIKLMLDHGARFDRGDRHGRSILDEAISILAEPLEIFREFYLKRGATINSHSLSTFATKSNYEEYLSIFVRGNNSKSRTPLKMRNNAVVAIQLLADSYCNENSILPAVQWFLDYKPSIKRLSHGALFSAVMSNKVKLVKLLIEYGVDVNRKKHEDSLICKAVNHENSDMAELLIKSGIDIHSRVPYVSNVRFMKYPIHIACACSAEKNIQLLLRSGVDVKVVGEHGETPFCILPHHNVLTNSHCIMIKHFVLLLEKGSRIHENDLKLIHEKSHMLKYSKDCSVELKKMVATQVLNNFSFYSFVSKNIGEATWFIRRNGKFLDNLSKYQYKTLFPLYSDNIEWLIKNAMEQRDILVQKEEAVFQILGKYLPDLVIEKIMHHLCLIDT